MKINVERPIEVKIACVLARDKGMTEKRGVTMWLPLGVMNEVFYSAVAPADAGIELAQLCMGEGEMLSVPRVADAVSTSGGVVSSDRVRM